MRTFIPVLTMHISPTLPLKLIMSEHSERYETPYQNQEKNFFLPLRKTMKKKNNNNKRRILTLVQRKALSTGHAHRQSVALGLYNPEKWQTTE